MVSKNVTAVSSSSRDFAQQPTAQRVVGTVVGPIVLGVVSGLLLGSTAIGYWIAQVVAMVGGFLGGTEHVGWRPGLLRGVVGGLLFGATILVVRSITGWSDEIDLGSTPGFLVVITTVVGLLLGAAGGAVRARRG
jgi:hypothetical protein